MKINGHYFSDMKKSLLFFLFFMATGWLIGETRLLLETPEQLKLRGVQHAVLPNGTFLAISENRLYHFSLSGKLIREIIVKNDNNNSYPVSAVYDIEQGYYWVHTLDGSFFYNNEGKYIGQAYQSDTEGRLVELNGTRLLVTNNRLFVIGLDPIDLWRNPSIRVISEVRYRVKEDGVVLVYRLGNPFYAMPDSQKNFNFNFSKHWLEEGPYHNDLYVVDELSPMIRHFVAHPEIDNGKQELKNKAVALSLPHFMPAPRGWNTRLKSEEEMNRWFSSWSRITGFFQYEQGFMVCYEVPDPEKGGHSRQLIQQVGRGGRAVGPFQEVAGYPLGVHEGGFYLIGGAEGRPSLIRLLP